jgi:superfamily II DNA/RNA helicase
LSHLKQASDPLKQYREWKAWVAGEDIKVADSLSNPIEILIATDVLSEGQNLQDCDLVINYDIHWNPVRVIQRMGRIDRIGSPNQYVYGVNFWPSNNIESYLNLKGRVEERMTAMRLGGAEVPLEFSQSFKEMAQDEDFENRLNERMLRQMETTWDDIDINEQSLGFDDFSLERFRQDLLQELNDRESFYKSMPKGVYSGFRAGAPNLPPTRHDCIAGLPYPTPKIT